MADLENLLLQAAGRTGGGASGRNRHSRPPSRRQREGSYSDDGSDSKDDESDDDNDHGYVSRKPSGSQIPIKKRLDPTERDDDRGSRGDDDDDEEDYEDGDDRRRSSSDDSDVGSDLYKDEYDREQLAQMTELEREMILSDRAQRRDDQRLTERVRAKQSGKKPQPVKEIPPPPSSSSARVRSSARSAERAAAKDDALNELRAKRMKQQDPEGFRKSRDAAARGGSYGERDSSPVARRKSVMAAASASSESSGSESESESRSRDEESAGNDELGESDEEKSPGKESLSLDDIKTITIRRSKLAKWLLEPFFEEVVVGCFVRLGIGKDRDDNSIYRLCKVLNVDASDPDKQYVLEGKSTHKYLHVIFGKSEARWQMDRVSNSPPLEKEFKEWVQQMEKTGGHMPSKNEVLEKQEAIQKAITYVYSAATVKQMLHEKKTASTRPLNVAAEKARLRRELEIAQSRRDGGPEVERIQARLQELENISRDAKEKDAKAVRLEEMNKRNRAENFKNASELKPVNTSLKAGEAGYDPFSRRWTRSRNYYVSNTNDDDGAEVSANGDLAPPLTGADGRTVANAGAISADGIAATAAALEAAAGAGKLVDTSAPVDHGTESNSLHDFELSISLTELQKFGGPQGAQLGFMARKQKIEATVGCRVPESDGRRHPLTLTVSDYKRRRGLL